MHLWNANKQKEEVELKNKVNETSLNEAEAARLVTNQTPNNQFDPFDEFNNEIETYGNQIFDMRLMHSKTRDNLNNKKVACMDKILDDIKKRYEYESELNQHDLSVKDGSESANLFETNPTPEPNHNPNPSEFVESHEKKEEENDDTSAKEVAVNFLEI